MPVNPAAALAIQVAKGILSMGWAFWSVDHVKQSHSGGPPPLTIKMSWPGVVNCQPECSQFGSIWDGLQIRSSSTEDIACWFVDTEYNGESFFVRHAYFTGAGEPYDNLKRALKAEVDEAAWASLYSTKSRPFAKPLSRKVAVKVINHYGDEVLKVI